MSVDSSSFKSKWSTYSKYYYLHAMEDRATYEHKLRTTGDSVDPYTIEKGQMCSNIEALSYVSYPDICNYLTSSLNPEYNLVEDMVEG